MEEHNIVTVNEVRDINTVTTEINTLTQQYRSLTLAYAVEVGRRLSEAKTLLPHGEWGTWLSERVSFSQRTANNLMRVFEEYGDAQITLLGAVPNSQTFANLPLSHAIKLLLVPADEREEFVEKQDVEHMSVRELDEAIKARKAAEERAEGLEAKLKNAEALLRETGADHDQVVDENRDLQTRLEEAERDMKVAQADAEKAREEAKKAKKALKEAKEHPEVPKDVLEKAAAEAAEQAKTEAEAKLQETVDSANKKIAEAIRAKEAAEKKYDELRQQAQLADPDVMQFKALFEQVQDDAAKLTAAYKRIAEKSPELAGKLAMALEKIAAEIVPK